jgi:hypothetical protein
VQGIDRSARRNPVKPAKGISISARPHLCAVRAAKSILNIFITRRYPIIGRKPFARGCFVKKATPSKPAQQDSFEANKKY